MTYSEARQRLRELLDSADQDGKAEIIRRDGRRYVLCPADEPVRLMNMENGNPSFSMLDVVDLLYEEEKRKGRRLCEAPPFLESAKDRF